MCVCVCVCDNLCMNIYIYIYKNINSWDNTRTHRLTFVSDLSKCTMKSYF